DLREQVGAIDQRADHGDADQLGDAHDAGDHNWGDGRGDRRRGDGAGERAELARRCRGPGGSGRRGGRRGPGIRPYYVAEVAVVHDRVTYPTRPQNPRMAPPIDRSMADRRPPFELPVIRLERLKWG